ncbi:RNA polymerase ECF-type sigma factor [Lacipirellula parvula]|uniref:RNA polymerase ECF-type sigma factor n=2 Tax=Lacipirellula parvula TaxID=2650471 RepID=A0A5K7XBP0_9BACT|nr:RNA polymerase ECF-type sigma factor [Lacipirellula parvula]
MGLGPLLQQYEEYLLLLARVEVGRRLQRKLDPSDLVQEVFLDAHRQFPNFRGTTESELLEWLRQILAGITANAMRHYLGVQGRDARRELEQDISGSFGKTAKQLHELAAVSGETPSQDAMRREQAVVVADAIQSLPDDYRDVLILRHWEGLSFPDVAIRLSKTTDSVEKLWMRALVKLRQQMKSAP